jgi:hypothetical protein
MAKNKQPQYATLFDIEINPPTEAVLEAMEADAEYYEFTQPQQPDYEFIDIIHRQHPDYICFCKKRTAAEIAALPPNYKGTPEFEQIVNLPAKRLPGLFTQVIESLGVDAYHTLNGIKRLPNYGPNKRGYVDADGNPLPAGYRKQNQVKWLTCCYVDLDCHKIGLTPGQTLGAVIDAVHAKKIPQPSILLDSGRGIWCLWLLKGISPEHPVLLTPDSLKLWEATEGRIIQTLHKLGADPAVRDTPRICRIPGSINSNAQRRASFFPWLDIQGFYQTYNLADLARGFGLNPDRIPPVPEPALAAPAPRLTSPRTTSTYVPRGPQKIGDILKYQIEPRYQEQTDSTEQHERIKNPVFQQAGIEGHKARWNNTRQRLFHLIRLRGCEIDVGHRNYVILTMVIINRRRHCNQKKNIEDIETNLAQFLKHGDSLDIAMAIRSTVKSVYANKTQKHLPNQKVADWLDITPREAEKTGWPYSSKFGPPPDTKPTPDQIRQQRQAKILEVVAANNGGVPSSREMLQALINAGIKIGKSAWRTVANDYAELGLVSDSKAGRRRKVSGDEPQLFQ